MKHLFAFALVLTIAGPALASQRPSLVRQIDEKLQTA